MNDNQIEKFKKRVSNNQTLLALREANKSLSKFGEALKVEMKKRNKAINNAFRNKI